VHSFKVSAIILAGGLVLPAVAQAPASSDLQDRARRLQMIAEGDARATLRPNRDAKAEAEKRQREFNLLLVDFTKSWNRLMKSAGQGGWNAKDARKTREAFERLLHSGAWIETQPSADPAPRPPAN